MKHLVGSSFSWSKRGTHQNRRRIKTCSVTTRPEKKEFIREHIKVGSDIMPSWFSSPWFSHSKTRRNHRKNYVKGVRCLYIL